MTPMFPTLDAAANVRITQDGYLLAQPRVARAGVEICDYPERNLYGLRVFRSASELFRPNIEFIDHLGRGGPSLSIGDNMFHQFFADGSPDFTSPHRPGFGFLDTNDTAKIAADAAYEEMRTRMDTCRRDRPDPVRDRGLRQLTLDELEQAASAAYEARSARMRTAWKDHHA